MMSPATTTSDPRKNTTLSPSVRGQLAVNLNARPVQVDPSGVRRMSNGHPSSERAAFSGGCAHPEHGLGREDRRLEADAGDRQSGPADKRFLPALFTRMSTLPSSRVACSIIAAISAGLDMSAAL